MKINPISKFNLIGKIGFNKKGFTPVSNAVNSSKINIAYPKIYYLGRISFGKRVKTFESTKEANEYFLKRYGAKTDFNSVEQAQTLDYAFRDFVFKTNIKNKKFLKGVEITSNDNNKTPIKVGAKIKYGYNLDEGLAEIYEKAQAEEKVAEFIKLYNPEVVGCKVLRLALFLDDNADWGSEDIEKNKAEIQSKLATLLHIKNCPFKYVIENQTPPNDFENEVIREVIECDSKDKNDFVERYILRRIQGETFSKEAVNLYRKFGGPNIFDEWTDYDFINVHFSSLKEAKKYFMEEYGIKANFTDVEQAYVVKSAIDDYLKLDAINDKKFLKGIEIAIKDKSELDKNANAEVQLSNYECIYNNDVSKLYEKYLRENREYKFFEENEPDIINVNRIVLCMRSDFGWESKPDGESYMADKSKEIIRHEIGHILHLKNYPYLYFLNYGKKAISEEEFETMKKVSNYASTNRLEFIAEYISKRISGKTFSKDVNELYKSLGGPNIFKDL